MIVLRCAQAWTRIDRDEAAFRRSLGLVFALALTVRVAHCWFLYRALGEVQILDAAYYHDEALRWAGFLAGPHPDGASATPFASQGYARALGLIYGHVGARALIALLVQAVLDALCAVLIGLVARRLLRERGSAFLAAACWALYAQAIHYAGTLLVPAASTFLAVFAVFALLRAIESGGGARRGTSRTGLLWALAAGLSIGVSALFRPTHGLLAVTLAGTCLALARFARGRVRAQRLSLAALTLLAGSALVVVPKVLAEHAASGAWVPISSNGGMNFWVGNNAAASGTYYTAPFLTAKDGGGHTYTVINERDSYLEEARRRAQQPEMALTASSTFWREEALREMSEQPLHWLALCGKKVFWFWNAREARTNVRMPFIARLSPIVRFDPLRFGALAILGSAGLVLLLKRGRRLASAVLLAVLAAPFLTCLLFFVSGEYRHAAAPALAIGSGFLFSRMMAGGERFKTLLARSGKWRLVGFGLLAVLVLYPAERERDIDDFKAYAEKMVMPGSDGQLPEPEDYDRAIRLLEHADQGRVERIVSREVLLLAHSNRAIQFRDLPSGRRLVETAKKLWQLKPRPEPGLTPAAVGRIHRNLLRRVAQLGQQPFVDADRGLSRDLVLLGANNYAEVLAYAKLKGTDAALAFIADAEELAPGSALLLAERGRVEFLAGRDESAVRSFELASNSWPKVALPVALLSEYFLKRGNIPQARVFFEAARRRDADAPEVVRLAGIFETLGAGR